MLRLEYKAIPPHESRRKVLDSLAILSGYPQEMYDGLPDGRRPDVLRLDAKQQRLFIGDAKDSESPSDLNTKVRLLAYFRWLSVHVIARGGCGTMAICFGNPHHINGWIITLEELAKEACIVKYHIGAERLDSELLVAWCDISN